MAQILALRPQTGLALPEATAAMPAWKSDQLDKRLAVFKPLMKALDDGASDAAAIELFVTLTGKGKATGYRWLAKYRAGGIEALAPAYKGRKRETREWHVRAQHLLTLPSKPNCGEVAARLRVEGFDGVTPDQVRALRNALPSHQAETSPKRLGAHHYRLNETPYVIRDWSHVPVGYLYELDGHTCDFYIEHPITGGYFRPELTFIVDVRSQYIVDFWLGGFENSTDLRWAVSRAFLQHDHVCREIHVDPGAFRAKTMVDPFSGFCAKLDVHAHFALPGNARGKGLIEGEYKIFEGRFGKFMPTYLHNRTDDALRNFADKWKKRLVPRYTVGQLCELIARDYVHQRRTEPRKGLDGASPAELWATLQRNPVMAPSLAVCRPRKQATVQNGRVQVHRRRYQNWSVMRAFENRPVLVEYDDWHDDKVWIYDLAGNFQGCAALVDKKPGIPESRVAERIAATAAGQRKRLELKLAEVEGRAQIPLTAHAALQALTSGAAATPVIEHEGTGLLDRGHSFAVPQARELPPPPAAEPVSAYEQLALQAAMEAAQITPDERPEQRYSRYLALRQQATDGIELHAADLDWLTRYADSAECAGLTDVYDSFGYLPGVTTPRDTQENPQ